MGQIESRMSGVLYKRTRRIKRVTITKYVCSARIVSRWRSRSRGVLVGGGCMGGGGVEYIRVPVRLVSGWFAGPGGGGGGGR